MADGCIVIAAAGEAAGQSYTSCTSHLLRRKRNCICLLLWFPSGSRSSGGQPELWPNLVTFAIPMSLSSSGVRRTTATQGTQGTAPMPWCPSSPSSSQLLLSWSDPTCETIPLSSCHQSIKRWSCIFAFFCNEDKSLSSSVQCSQEWEWKKSEGLLTRQVLCLPFISKWFGETDFLLPSLLSPALHHNHWPTAANVTAMRFIYLIKCEQRPQQITNQSRRKREFHTIANNKIGGPRLNPRSLFTLVCSQQNCPRKYSVLYLQKLQQPKNTKNLFTRAQRSLYKFWNIKPARKLTRQGT